MSNRFTGFIKKRLIAEGWLSPDQANRLRAGFCATESTVLRAVAQLRAERDALRADLEKAQAELKSWRAEVAGTASGATFVTIKNLTAERDAALDQAFKFKAALYGHVEYPSTGSAWEKAAEYKLEIEKLKAELTQLKKERDAAKLELNEVALIVRQLKAELKP
jgi:uncharacterized coiled-coil DUF342 family protein